MIHSVAFENFRCLKSARLRLAPLTILLGPNASGKSSVLRGLDSSYIPNSHDIYKGQPLLNAKIDRHLEKGIRSTSFNGTDRLRSGPFYSFKLLHLLLDNLRQQNELQLTRSLSPVGDGLANFFGSLTRREQVDLAKQLCQLVPMYGDVDTRPTKHGHHQLIFQDRWNPDLWYTPDQVSDGTILVLAYLILQYEENPPDLLAIEEPERGIHPYLLGKLIALFRALATGQIGKKPMQIVLATHSAELLDYARPEEVRFLSRSKEDGSVTIEEPPVDEPQWEKAFEVYRHRLSEMWLSGGLASPTWRSS